MKPVILLVHGIGTFDKGQKSMLPLQQKLAGDGYDARIVSYGFVFLPTTNRTAVLALQNAIKPFNDAGRPVIVCGYSNGGWAAVQAAETGSKIDHLVLVSPALHKRHAFPEIVTSARVFYSRGDYVLTFARFRRWLRKKIPYISTPHGWGEMGRVGYEGTDVRVTNYKLARSVRHWWYKSATSVNKVADVIKQLK